MSRFLVTGGAGFLGSHIAEGLLSLKNSEVTILDNFWEGKKSNVPKGCKVVKADITSKGIWEKVLEGVDVVFHHAAVASVPYSVAHTRRTFKINTDATFKLAEAALKLKNTPKIVFASSAAVYGPPKKNPVPESAPMNPVSPYGASKAAGDTLLRAYHASLGLPVVCLRYFNVYGPRQPRYFFFDFLTKVKKSKDSIEVIGTGRQARDFVFAKDAVRATILCSRKKRAEGRAVNIGTEKQTTVRQVAETFLELLGLEKSKQLYYTGQSWKGDIEKFYADNSVLKSFGWKQKYTLSQGLKSEIDWFEKTYGKLR